MLILNHYLAKNSLEKLRKRREKKEIGKEKAGFGQRKRADFMLPVRTGWLPTDVEVNRAFSVLHSLMLHS